MKDNFTIQWEGRSFSYDEFLNLSRKYASFLKDYKECVFIWETNVESMAAFYGALIAGCKPAFFSIPTFKTDTEYFKKQVVSIATNTKVIASPTYSEYGEVIDLGKTSLFSGTEISADGFYQFSSGTTGNRKKIYYGFDKVNLYLNWMRDIYVSKFPPLDAIVTWIPIYHDMGLVHCFLYPLLFDLPIVGMNNLNWIKNPSSMLDMLSTVKRALVLQPNFAYNLLTTRYPSVDLSNHLFFNSGEPVTEFTCKNFQDKFNAPCYGQYGMAEVVLSITNASNCKTYKGHASSGVPFNDQCKVMIDNGEICVQSPYMFDGYVSGEPSNILDGWYHTGDLGEIIDDELYVFGRKDDMIITSGQNIYPETIENIVSTISGVTKGRVCCFGRWNDSKQTTDVVLIYEGNCAELDIRKTLAAFPISKVQEVPERWIIKSTSGKVARKANAQKYEECYG